MSQWRLFSTLAMCHVDDGGLAGRSVMTAFRNPAFECPELIFVCLPTLTVTEGFWDGQTLFDPNCLPAQLMCDNAVSVQDLTQGPC